MLGGCQSAASSPATRPRRSLFNSARDPTKVPETLRSVKAVLTRRNRQHRPSLRACQSPRPVPAFARCIPEPPLARSHQASVRDRSCASPWRLRPPVRGAPEEPAVAPDRPPNSGRVRSSTSGSGSSVQRITVAPTSVWTPGVCSSYWPSQTTGPVVACPWSRLTGLAM